MPPRVQRERLTVEHFGPLRSVELRFGDLTVLVGPQASGKSLALQLWKLALDRRFIEAQLQRWGFRGNTHAERLELVLGEGFRSLLTDKTRLVSTPAGVDPRSDTRTSSRKERALYVPAQRALCMRRGWPLDPLSQDPGTPYVMRRFGATLLEQLNRSSALRREVIFPESGRLRKELRKALAEAIFRGGELRLRERPEGSDFVLRFGDQEGPSLPMGSWTAGQREAITMLLGLLPALPSGGGTKAAFDWILLEEPEAGLHPKAITAMLALVGELLVRGYRVVMTTHSTDVLDVLWGLRVLRDSEKAKNADVGRLFGLSEKAVAELNVWGAKLLKKSVRVYAMSFDEQGKVTSKDISALDPGSENPLERTWGGLTEFASRANAVVASVASRGAA